MDPTSSRIATPGERDRRVMQVHAERNARLRSGAPTLDDIAHMRIIVMPSRDYPYRCDCRCHCHSAGSGGAPTATGATAGSCGLRIDMDTLDCGRACRASHILASDCTLDETRRGAHL